jgi:hypothetical protein
MLASNGSFADYPGLMEPDAVARGALAFLGKGPIWVAGAANRATAKALSPVPRIPVINAMSEASASIYGLAHVPATGVEFQDDDAAG